MGIRGLTSLLKKYVPESMTVYSFSYFKNSTIAIDTSILLYKFRYLSDSNKYSHISGFLNKCFRYISFGIIPVFILDGKPPVEKKEILIKRTNQRQKIVNKIEILTEKLTLSDTDVKTTQCEIRKLNKQVIYITKEHRDDSKELLQYLGFSVISSPGEAESMCAKLQENGTVDFTFTDDTDALVLGCKKVLRSNSPMNTFTEIDLDKVLIGLKLEYTEFVDLCILCGCDYCPTIPRVGYLTAYNLILEHRTIENVLEVIKDTYDIPSNYTYESARKIFKNDVEKMNVNKNSLDENKLTRFLLQRNFRKDYIVNYIKKFKQKLNYINKFKQKLN
jgi:flap endonuclease-1